ncbi:ROK family transcriptional regulator [Occallatibacter riparius]|uniref:ROK family transcriptional regulator n=1 Tax=Occallatibacter riparius TaxID=1002689 RepID=A0A9J7BPD3_9BACT|nr:ROK family transcriptional regulator [Occallatibacter riparius]UWZ84611.1 ROK family transcriptional regulator [Occallatibacter riparius]
MSLRNISTVNERNRSSRLIPKDRSSGRAQAMSPIRDSNRDLVLEVLRRNQPISRVDIARRSGLQRSTISSIVDELIEERWAREGSVVKTERGRRPTMLTMNDDLLLLVADVRPTKAILAVVDLNGRFLDRAVVPIIADAKEGVELIAAGMRQLRSNFPGKRWEGVGISLPGRVNKITHKLAWAPNLPWVGFDIRGTLQKALKLQVELENAANACLLSEVWFGHLEGVQNAVLITIAEGVGASAIVNGTLMEGAEGLAGELGHVTVSDSGPRCACGQVGCWEMFASCRAALRYFHEEMKGKGAATIQDLLNLEANGDKAARAALNWQAEWIGRGMRVVTAGFNPELILFVGDITLRWDAVGPIVRAELTKRLVGGAQPKIAIVSDGEAARLRGAAAVLLQRHISFKRTSRSRKVAVTA